MLNMQKRHQIQVLAQTERSHDQVAALTGVSRRSVERIANEPPVEHFDDAAERKRRRVGRPSKADAFAHVVAQCFDEDPALPTIEILRRAKLAGYQGAKSAFYDLVKRMRPEGAGKLVVRFEGLPGEFTQHDFGEVRVRYLDGTCEKLTFLATRLKYSRWVVVSLVPNQQAETLVRALCTHFERIEGVPLLAVFDRPRTVALEWRKDGTITRYNSIFAEALQQMGCGVEVCWPHSPEQKGSVENLVGWVKGSFFKVRRFVDRDDLLDQLAQWHHEVNEERPCRATGVTPRSRLATDQHRLRPLKTTSDQLALRVPIQVGPSALVTHEARHYSMPPATIGRRGTLMLYAERVRIVVDQVEVEHPRLFERDARSMLPEHLVARVAAVSGRRGKLYLKRQDVLEVGEIAMVLLDEIVHQRPDGWSGDVERLHELLQRHGAGALRLAMHMAVGSSRFSAEAVAAELCGVIEGGPL